MMREYHLAQVNIARMRGPIDSPIMAGFVEQLEYINSVADRAPGFVWRLQTEDGDATAVRAFDDERIIVNMSVWESVEALHDYVYRSDHLGPLRQRKEWFERLDGPALVLWWVPAGHIPTLDEAKERLDHVGRHGATPTAFTFKCWYPAPGSGAAGQPAELEGCQSGG